MTIPVRGPVNGLWALFCLTTMDSDSEWAERRNVDNRGTLTLNISIDWLMH
jgi:hypothetical protein